MIHNATPGDFLKRARLLDACHVCRSPLPEHRRARVATGGGWATVCQVIQETHLLDDGTVRHRNRLSGAVLCEACASALRDWLGGGDFR